MQNTACIYRSFGHPEVLEIVEDWPYPELEENGVIIKVAAVSINPKDTLLRKGKFSKIMAREPLPRGTAMDASGEVVETGKQVQKFKSGDRVYGMTNRFSGGLLCHYVQLASSEIAMAPDAVSIEDSASIPLAALTALQALRDCCGCRKGTRILVIGASGGVGHFAVQIGKIVGAEVHAACSKANIEFVRSLGADKIFDYKEVDLTIIEDHYDVVFDVVGYYHRSQFKQHLGNNGIFVSTVPKPASIWAELLSRLRIKNNNRLVIVRSNTADLEQLKEWVDKGMLRPAVTHRFQLNDIRLAHVQMQTGHTQGKIVVTT